jgi:hypothetical protein
MDLHISFSLVKHFGLKKYLVDVVEDLVTTIRSICIFGTKDKTNLHVKIMINFIRVFENFI